MTSRETTGPRYGHRIAWLAVAIVVAIAAYSAGWYWLAGQVEARTAAAIAGVGARGDKLECTQRETRGYPFRLGLFCDELSFADTGEKVEMKGKGFRTAAQVYNPFHVVGELDEIWIDWLGVTPGLGVNGKDVRFSAVLDRKLPERVSMTIKDVSVDENPFSRGLNILLRAGEAEAHMRRNGPDVDLAFTAQDVAFQGAAGVRVPQASADITVRDGVRLAEALPQSLRGLSIELRNVALKADGEAGIALSGPVTVDAQGLVDATLQINVQKPQALAAQLAVLAGGNAANVETALKGMAMFGDSASVPLSIEKGRARIAFITLGQIPPVR